MGRRMLAWVLILYGVLGLVLVLGGAAIGLDVTARIERLTATADGTLAAAARSTDVAAEAFTNVDASLTESQASADAAAELARDASVTMASLAQAMELSVFGAQPLLPLAAEFEASAEQASALAGTLDLVAASLGDTRTDVSRIGTELDGLSSELSALREANGTSGAGTGTAPPLRIFVLLLLAWLLIPAAGGLLMGLSLLRPPRVSEAAG